MYVFAVHYDYNSMACFPRTLDANIIDIINISMYFVDCCLSFKNDELKIELPEPLCFVHELLWCFKPVTLH